MPFVHDGGHFTHRIDGQIVRALHRAVVIQPNGIIGGTDLFQHPARYLSPRMRIGIEDEIFGHCGLSFKPFGNRADHAGFAGKRKGRPKSPLFGTCIKG